jgi:RHH-type transcriptional regulator, proline utilization regulon repressor / proline dehydrogenase / delta 1-pyrroline-5-carboxylate dehydrogenase
LAQCIQILQKNAVSSDLVEVWVHAWRSVAVALASLPPQNQYLPGPTGERNHYRWQPRGRILCAGGTQNWHLYAQLLSAWAVGNTPVLMQVVSLPAALQGYTYQITSEQAAPPRGDSWDAVFCYGEPSEDIPAQGTLEQAQWRVYLAQQLIEQQGAIVPLVCTPTQACYWVHEQHICTDTTSAGGNVELLACHGIVTNTV